MLNTIEKRVVKGDMKNMDSRKAKEKSYEFTSYIRGNNRLGRKHSNNDKRKNFKMRFRKTTISYTTKKLNITIYKCKLV